MCPFSDTIHLILLKTFHFALLGAPFYLLAGVLPDTWVNNAIRFSNLLSWILCFNSEFCWSRIKEITDFFYCFSNFLNKNPKRKKKAGGGDLCGTELSSWHTHCSQDRPRENSEENSMAATTDQTGTWRQKDGGLWVASRNSTPRNWNTALYFKLGSRQGT